MNTKHTPGPWYADREGSIWRRPPSDLYQNGGSVAGDRALASVHRGWYGKDETGFPVEANARLIAAAPELLEALIWMVDNDETNEGDTPMPDQGGATWNEINAYWIDGLNRAR